MPAWMVKAERTIDTGRVVTLEYEDRDLEFHIPDGRDPDAVIADYGQRLVAIVEDAKREPAQPPHPPIPDDNQDPKRPCSCAGKKSLGLLSLGKALLGPRATPEEAARRLAICQACQATDPTGARLYRIIDGKAYCGVPRLSDLGRVYREETKWGCGCELMWKAGMAEVRCPLGRW